MENMCRRWPAAAFAERIDGAEALAEPVFRPKAGASALPLCPHGTNFRIRVWDALLRIQPGALPAMAMSRRRSTRRAWRGRPAPPSAATRSPGWCPATGSSSRTAISTMPQIGTLRFAATGQQQANCHDAHRSAGCRELTGMVDRVTLSIIRYGSGPPGSAVPGGQCPSAAAISLMKGAATSALILQSMKIGPSGAASSGSSASRSSRVRSVRAS